ncbi:MAG: LiaI-LiaF-like domain-containing protein [Terriglobales bacterium]
METYQPNPACDCFRCRAQGLMAPVVLVTLGTLFLLDQVTRLAFERWWPMLLVAIGVVIILQRSGPMEGHVPPPEAPLAATPPPAAGQAPQAPGPGGPTNETQVPHA